MASAREFTLSRRALGPGSGPFIFMDDNSSVHKAGIAGIWKDEKGIKSLNWPSKSPDLNILENIRAYLCNELYKRKKRLHTRTDVWVATQEYGPVSIAIF